MAKVKKGLSDLAALLPKEEEVKEKVREEIKRLEVGAWLCYNPRYVNNPRIRHVARITNISNNSISFDRDLAHLGRWIFFNSFHNEKHKYSIVSEEEAIGFLIKLQEDEYDRECLRAANFLRNGSLPNLGGGSGVGGAHNSKESKLGTSWKGYNGQ